MIAIDNAECPSCGEPELTVSLEAILSGVDTVYVECGACQSVFTTDLVFKEEADEGPTTD